ncbi:MAG: hypothetical protein Q8O67_23045 [Deltaproteobacteria bacterium]|nr:hypothetical protein [Deltaproteobacteria bacterium]
MIGKLEPGNTAKLGGKAELSSGYTIGGEANIEVKRTDKGKYEVKIDQRAFLGAGTENGEGHHKTGAKAVGVAAGEVTLEFATAEEAAAFTAKATKAAAAGQLLMPIGPGGAQVAVGVAIGTSREHISEVKLEYGIEVEADVEKHIIGPLEAIGGAAAEATGALVFVPPDEAFMELKVKGELKAEVLAKAGPGSVGVGGGMEGTLTVRIPLGHVASAEEMAKPEVQQRLREQAERNPEGTTMTWESKIILPGIAGNVTRTSEKTINGNSLEEMFNGKDFNTRVSVDVGPNPHGGVGPLTVEVTAQHSVTLYEVNDGTLAEQDKEIAAHKSQIENKALKAKAKG